MARFVRAHLAYLLLLPLVVEWGTLYHAAAHAAAVAVQGGQITLFDLWPGRGADGHFRFGEVQWTGALWSEGLVDLAPGLASTLIAAVGFVVGLRARPSAGWRIFLLSCYFLPLTDVSMSFAGLYGGSPSSDYYKALHGLEGPVAPLAIAYFFLLVVAGWAVFQRAWPAALSWAEYAIGGALVLALPWLRYAL